MSARKIANLFLALVVAAIAAILLFAPDAESGERAVKLINVLFSKSESLMEVSLPNEAVLVAHGKKRKLSMADFEELHQIFSGGQLPGNYPGVTGAGVQLVKIADLKLTYARGRLSFPIYRLAHTKIYRVEIPATGLNSVSFISDDSSEFEKFLAGEIVSPQKGILLMNPK